MNPSRRYQPEMLQDCPEMLPHLAKAHTHFGKLALMMAYGYAPYIQSGARTQDQINSVFLLATLMSSIPAEALLAFSLRSVGASNEVILT